MRGAELDCRAKVYRFREAFARSPERRTSVPPRHAKKVHVPEDVFDQLLRRPTATAWQLAPRGDLCRPLPPEVPCLEAVRGPHFYVDGNDRWRVCGAYRPDLPPGVCAACASATAASLRSDNAGVCAACASVRAAWASVFAACEGATAASLRAPSASICAGATRGSRAAGLRDAWVWDESARVRAASPSPGPQFWNGHGGGSWRRRRCSRRCRWNVVGECARGPTPRSLQSSVRVRRRPWVLGNRGGHQRRANRHVWRHRGAHRSDRPQHVWTSD
mmetsp:Transcript_41903/g.115525  ORF Transcript_41903/g.115525 Transcript_41903/m.115525 type:complete len:275 (-) Transcript_41903:176-1000(-)